MKVQSFFVMDENFLLHKKRAMELLEQMKEKAKSWSLYVFSSVNAISKYTMEELVELGVSQSAQPFADIGLHVDLARGLHQQPPAVRPRMTAIGASAGPSTSMRSAAGARWAMSRA